MLRVFFYDPRKDNEGVFNKVIAYSDPPFCHCELQFPNQMTCSIYMGTTVSFKIRQKFGDAYTMLEIPATPTQVSLAYKVCQDNFDAKQRFSTLEMLACFSPWKTTVSSTSDLTFCSKLVAEALQAAGLFPIHQTTSVSPSSLHRILLGELQKTSKSTYTAQASPVFDACFHHPRSNTSVSQQPIPVLDFADNMSILN